MVLNYTSSSSMEHIMDLPPYMVSDLSNVSPLQNFDATKFCWGAFHKLWVLEIHMVDKFCW